MHTSPWWIYVIVGALVLCVIVDFTGGCSRNLDASRMRRPSARAIVLATVTALLFAYSATPGLAQSDNVRCSSDGPRCYSRLSSG